MSSLGRIIMSFNLSDEARIEAEKAEEARLQKAIKNKGPRKSFDDDAKNFFAKKKQDSASTTPDAEPKQPPQRRVSPTLNALDLSKAAPIPRAASLADDLGFDVNGASLTARLNKPLDNEDSSTGLNGQDDEVKVDFNLPSEDEFNFEDAQDLGYVTDEDEKLKRTQAEAAEADKQKLKDKIKPVTSILSNPTDTDDEKGASAPGQDDESEWEYDGSVKVRKGAVPANTGVANDLENNLDKRKEELGSVDIMYKNYIHARILRIQKDSEDRAVLVLETISDIVGSALLEDEAEDFNNALIRLLGTKNITMEGILSGADELLKDTSLSEENKQKVLEQLESIAPKIAASTILEQSDLSPQEQKEMKESLPNADWDAESKYEDFDYDDNCFLALISDRKAVYKARVVDMVRESKDERARGALTDQQILDLATELSPAEKKEIEFGAEQKKRIRITDKTKAMFFAKPVADQKDVLQKAIQFLVDDAHLANTVDAANDPIAPQNQQIAQDTKDAADVAIQVYSSNGSRTDDQIAEDLLLDTNSHARVLIGLAAAIRENEQKAVAEFKRALTTGDATAIQDATKTTHGNEKTFATVNYLTVDNALSKPAKAVLTRAVTVDREAHDAAVAKKEVKSKQQNKGNNMANQFGGNPINAQGQQGQGGALKRQNTLQQMNAAGGQIKRENAALKKAEAERDDYKAKYEAITNDKGEGSIYALKKEVKKAKEELAAFKKKFSDAGIDLNAPDALEKLKGEQEENKKLKEDLKKSEEDRKAAEKKNAAVKENLAELESDLKEAGKDYKALKDENDDLEAKNQDLDYKNKQLAKEKDALARENGTLKAVAQNAGAAEKQLVQLQGDVAELKKQLTEKTDEAKDLAQKLQKANDEKAAKDVEIDKLKRAKDEADAKLLALDAKYKDALKRISLEASQALDAGVPVEKVMEQLKKRTDEFDAKMQQIEQAHAAKVAELEGKLAAAEADKSSLSDQVVKLKEQVTTLSNEKSDLIRENGKKDIKILEWESANAKLSADLQSANASKGHAEKDRDIWKGLYEKEAKEHNEGKDSNTQLSKEIADLISKNKTLQQQSDAHFQTTKLQRTELDEANKLREQFKQLADEKEQARQNAVKVNNDLNARVTNLNADVEEKTAELTKKDGLLAKAAKDRDANAEELRKANEELAKKVAEIGKLKNDVSLKEQTVIKHAATIVTLGDDKNDLNAKLTAANQNLTAKEQELAAEQTKSAKLAQEKAAEVEKVRLAGIEKNALELTLKATDKVARDNGEAYTKEHDRAEDLSRQLTGAAAAAQTAIDAAAREKAARELAEKAKAEAEQRAMAESQARAKDAADRLAADQLRQQQEALRQQAEMALNQQKQAHIDAETKRRQDAEREAAALRLALANATDATKNAAALFQKHNIPFTAADLANIEGMFITAISRNYPQEIKTALHAGFKEWQKQTGKEFLPTAVYSLGVHHKPLYANNPALRGEAILSVQYTDSKYIKKAADGKTPEMVDDGYGNLVCVVNNDSLKDDSISDVREVSYSSHYKHSEFSKDARNAKPLVTNNTVLYDIGSKANVVLATPTEAVYLKGDQQGRAQILEKYDGSGRANDPRYSKFFQPVSNHR
jgi:hypothetical protein